MSDRPNKKQKISIELNTDDILNIINYYFEKNDYKTSLEYYEKLESYDDTNNIYYSNNLLKIGYCYRTLKKYDQSIETYNKIVQNDNYIYDYDFSKDCNLDLKYFNIINNIIIIKNLLIGHCYMKLKNYEKSIECLNNIKNIENIREFYNIYKIVIEMIITCYEKDKEKYHDELLDLYTEYNNHHNSDKYLNNILEFLKKYKSQKDINVYIKNNILHNDFEYLSNCDIIDKYFVPESDEDVILISEKYFYYNNKNKLIELFDKIEKNELNLNKSDTKLNILHNIIKIITHEFKYYYLFFDIYDDLSDDDKNNNIRIFESIKRYFNYQLLNNDYSLIANIKYKKYFDRKNLDLINNNLSEYLFLSELFKNNEIIIDKCIVCYDEKQIIKLNCHHTHVLCSDCYKKLNFCPMCRDEIYK